MNNFPCESLLQYKCGMDPAANTTSLPTIKSTHTYTVSTTTHPSTHMSTVFSTTNTSIHTSTILTTHMPNNSTSNLPTIHPTEHPFGNNFNILLSLHTWQIRFYAARQDTYLEKLVYLIFLCTDTQSKKNF